MGKTFEHNSDVIVNADDTVEIFFNQDGVDVVTGAEMKWYYALEKPARQMWVKCDKISQITEVNGESPKSPINIAANGSFVHSQNYGVYHKYVKIKVKLLNATTNLEVGGIC